MVVGLGCGVLAGIDEEAFDVFLFQYFDTALGHAFQDHLSNLYADEFFDEVTVGFEEATDFAFFAVVEVDFEASGVAFTDLGSGKDFLGFEEFALVFDAVEEFGDVGFVEIAVQDDAITFDDLITGVSESMGEVSVIGKDEEAFAVLVEASGAEHALPLEVGREEIKNGLSAVRVGVGAEEAFGFIEDEGDRSGALGGEEFFINGDGVGGEAFVAELSDFPIVAHFALANEGLGFAAGAESGVGDNFLEALCFGFRHGSTSVERGRGCQCCGKVRFVLALPRVS